MARVLVIMLLVACSTAGRAFAQATAEEQFDLAGRYFNGDGVARDAAAAVEWYKKAADQGHVTAQLFLGMRESLKATMSSDEIVAAQRASREWKPEQWKPEK